MMSLKQSLCSKVTLPVWALLIAGYFTGVLIAVSDNWRYKKNH